MIEHVVPVWSGQFLHIASLNALLMMVHCADERRIKAPFGWRHTGEVLDEGSFGEFEVHVYERGFGLASVPSEPLVTGGTATYLGLSG